MKQIYLNDKTPIDLDVLIDTKLLIQANSGGGKSWAIRRLLEQSHGHVQQIVIDLEGEFSTLREKYDYVLAGKGGDTPADPKSAGLLARKLLELNVSAIIDLYELDHYDRKRFVKVFLDALVDAPKELWHPALIIIDEAHVFCPEKGQSEAMGSVIDLATRGRKRGFCAVLATQRLSKLHKDAAAECNNKLIGRTGLDVDMKRASEELGFTSKEQYLSLRSLDPGEFFTFGPAISTQVSKVEIGKVETTHPKAGSRILSAPPIPPTSKIKDVLSKLSDLPKEAEEEAKTVDDLRRQIRELKRQKPEIDIDKAVEPHLIAFRSVENGYKNTIQQWKEYADELIKALKTVNKISNHYGSELTPPSETAGVSYAPEKSRPSIGVDLADPKKKDYSVTSELPSSSDERLPLTARKIYGFLYANPDRTFTKVQLGGVTGYSHNSGGFNNSLSRLNTLGLIRREGSMIGLGRSDPSLVDEGTEEYSPELWLNKLPLAPKKVYEYLWNNPDEQVTKEQLGEITGYSHTSGGFNNALARLNALGLITRLGNSLISLNKELLEL